MFYFISFSCLNRNSIALFPIVKMLHTSLTFSSHTLYFTMYMCYLHLWYSHSIHPHSYYWKKDSKIASCGVLIFAIYGLNFKRKYVHVKCQNLLRHFIKNKQYLPKIEPVNIYTSQKKKRYIGFYLYFLKSCIINFLYI